MNSGLFVGSEHDLTLLAFPLLGCVAEKWGSPEKPAVPECEELNLFSHFGQFGV